MKTAICGKGGVGKSTISAFLINALASQGRRVLAIDADPSPHLARLLGFPKDQVPEPVASMTELLQERTEREGAFYNMNPKVSDLPEKFLVKQDNISLMVLGAIQQGGAGCACAENAVLRNLLNMLLLSPDEDVILDMEAGVEHLGRGTIAATDHILVVVQPYRGSIETASRIKSLAADIGIKSLHIVANNVRDDEDMDFIEQETGIRPIVAFRTSDEVRRAERKGIPLSEAGDGFSRTAQELVKKLEEINAGQ